MDLKQPLKWQNCAMKTSRPSTRFTILLVLIALATAAFLIRTPQYKWAGSGQRSLVPELEPEATYRQALQSHCTPDGNITLIYVDDAFVDMAMNQYEYSIVKLKLFNTLFVSPTKSACDYLVQRKVSCYFYPNLTRSGVNEIAADRPAVYGSPNFWAKVASRSRFVYEALELNYTVFHIDADVLLLKDPWVEFTCSACDMEILSETLDHGNANVGTVLNRPTPGALNIYRELTRRMAEDPFSRLQKQFNDILDHNAGKKITYRYLDTSKFQCGKKYFMNQRLLSPYAAPCPKCVLIHNNFIITKQAKVYRFKENLMWIYDDNQYYSNKTARYLLYDNLPDGMLKTDSSKQQLHALANALAIGRILNRIVILPAFFCANTPKKRCSLISLISIAVFERTFKDRYRESTFLRNPKVPSEVRSNISKKIQISRDTGADENNFVPASSAGASSDEILKWFQPMADIRILQFGYLHHAFSGMTNAVDEKTFRNDVKGAFFADNDVQTKTGNRKDID